MKKTIINRIIDERVIKTLTERFKEKGFKYNKANKSFVKNDIDFKYQIFIYDRYEIYMDGSINKPYDLYLVFDMNFETSLPEFDKWYKNEFGVRNTIYIFYKKMRFGIPLKEGEDFKMPDDFDTNQQTYIGEEMHLIDSTSNNIYKLSCFGREIEIKDFESYFNSIFLTLKEQTEKKYDFEKIALENNNSFRHISLLIYTNRLEIPKKFILNKTEELILKLDSDVIEDNKKLELNNTLEMFISIGKKYLGLNIVNPYKSINKDTFRCIENQKETISIYENINYKEFLRIDYGKLKKRIGYSVNMSGNILVYINYENIQKSNKFYVVNRKGEILADKEVDVSILNMNYNIGQVKNTSSFYLLNYIIDGNNGKLRDLNFNKNKSLFIKEMTVFYEKLIITFLYKIIIIKDGKKTKEIKSPRRTEIIHNDIQNNLFYSKNKKGELFQVDYDGNILKVFKLPKTAFKMIIRDNYIYSFSLSKKRLMQIDMSTGNEKLMQKSTMDPAEIIQFDKNTNILLANNIAFGPYFEIYNRDFSIKKGSLRIANKNDFITFRTKNFLIKRDEAINNIVVFDFKSNKL